MSKYAHEILEVWENFIVRYLDFRNPDGPPERLVSETTPEITIENVADIPIVGPFPDRDTDDLWPL